MYKPPIFILNHSANVCGFLPLVPRVPSLKSTFNSMAACMGGNVSLVHTNHLIHSEKESQSHDKFLPTRNLSWTVCKENTKFSTTELASWFKTGPQKPMEVYQMLIFMANYVRNCTKQKKINYSLIIGRSVLWPKNADA